MHIGEGMLPLSVTIPSFVVAGAATAYCLNKVQEEGDPREHIPKAALLAAAFFTLSTIQIPIPPASVHLILGGLMGVMLGWYSIPAVMVALFFQAVMFSHGGLTTLGVNGIILGIPPIVAYGIFQLYKPKETDSLKKSGAIALVASLVATTLSVGLFVGFLTSAIPDYLDQAAERSAIVALAFAHVPVIIVEAIVTAFIVVYLRRNKPQLLSGL